MILQPMGIITIEMNLYTRMYIIVRNVREAWVALAVSALCISPMKQNLVWYFT